jgi:hypothetical protein
VTYGEGRDGDEEREDDEDRLLPDERDYDLSEDHGYMWEPKRREWPLPSWAMIVVSLLVVAGLVAPALILVLRNS